MKNNKISCDKIILKYKLIPLSATFHVHNYGHNDRIELRPTNFYNLNRYDKILSKRSPKQFSIHRLNGFSKSTSILVSSEISSGRHKHREMIRARLTDINLFPEKFVLAHIFLIFWRLCILQNTELPSSNNPPYRSEEGNVRLFPAMFSNLFTFDLSIIGEVAMTTLIFGLVPRNSRF